MKNVIAIISVFFLLFLGVRVVESIPFSQKGTDVSCENSDVHAPSAFISDSLDNTFCLDAQSMSRQQRLGGRGQRSLLMSFSAFSKIIIRKSITTLSVVLDQSIHRIVSTVPCLNWEFASDHYIFGMRRILI